MIETRDITKMVAHIVRRDKGIADPQLMHPTREWFWGLTIATVLVLLGSWFCVYIYNAYTQIMHTEISVSELAVPYQAATIAEAITVYENKKLKFSEILGITAKEEDGEVGTTTQVILKEVISAPVRVEPILLLKEESTTSVDERLPTAVLAP